LLKYILKRIIHMLIALFIIISATFFLMKAAPGNPFASERDFPPEIEANLRAKYEVGTNLKKHHFLQGENDVFLICY